MIMRPDGGWVYERVTTHPGEMLREEFMAPLNISVELLAEKTRIPEERVRALVEERAPMTAEMAMRISRCVGFSPEMWLALQTGYDLSKAVLEKKDAVEREVEPVRAPVAA